MCSGDRSGHGTGLPCASDHGGEVLNSVLFEAAQPRQGAAFGVADWDTVEGVKQHRETVGLPLRRWGVVGALLTRAGPPDDLRWVTLGAREDAKRRERLTRDEMETGSSAAVSTR
jgi:hypothetical protein